MTRDEINDLAESLLPKGYTFEIGLEIGGLCYVGITRPDGIKRGTYVAPGDGKSSVRYGISNVIESLGGKPKKEDEE